MPKERPKSRWKDSPQTIFSEIKESPGARMDAGFYRAKAVLMQILGELRHDTEPSIEEFMEGIDFILDHPKLVRAAVESYKE